MTSLDPFKPRSLAFVLTLLVGSTSSFLGCGTSSTSASQDGGTSTAEGGADASITLPSTLETCGATAPMDNAASFNGSFQVTVPTIHLGDGVRMGALVGTPGSQTAFEKATGAAFMGGGSGSLSLVSTDDASPLIAYTGDPANYDYGNHVDAITDPLPINAFEQYGTVTGAHAFTTKQFEGWVQVDPKLDISWRASYQAFGDVASGSGFTSTGASTMTGDQYLFEIGAALLLDVDVRIRPAGDAACHIRNIKRVLSPGGVLAPDADTQEVSLDDLSDASVNAYLQMYGVKGTTHALALGTVAGDPFAGTTPCDLSQAAACTTWQKAVTVNARALLSNVPNPPSADDLFKGTVPKGWIIIAGIPTPVP
jgi:hypothetical protein